MINNPDNAGSPPKGEKSVHQEMINYGKLIIEYCKVCDPNEYNPEIDDYIQQNRDHLKKIQFHKNEINKLYPTIHEEVRILEERIFNKKFENFFKQLLINGYPNLPTPIISDNNNFLNIARDITLFPVQPSETFKAPSKHLLEDCDNTISILHQYQEIENLIKIIEINLIQRGQAALHALLIPILGTHKDMNFPPLAISEVMEYSRKNNYNINIVENSHIDIPHLKLKIPEIWITKS